jgi:hypothetical protein
VAGRARPPPAAAAARVTQITACRVAAGDMSGAMSVFEGSRLSSDKVLLFVAIALGILTTALSL